MIDPKMADSHESISNPGRIPAQILRTAPFTTKVNRPRVSILIGRVRNIKNGQMTILANPITAAATSAEVKPLTLKPRTTFAVMRSATDETTQ